MRRHIQLKTLTEVSIKNYLDDIPDKDLVMLAEHDWDSLKEFCLLLTLDLELIEQDNPPQNLPN
jgi:hypothetical protein